MDRRITYRQLEQKHSPSLEFSLLNISHFYELLIAQYVDSDVCVFHLNDIPAPGPLSLKFFSRPIYEKCFLKRCS